MTTETVTEKPTEETPEEEKPKEINPTERIAEALAKAKPDMEGAERKEVSEKPPDLVSEESKAEVTDSKIYTEEDVKERVTKGVQSGLDTRLDPIYKERDAALAEVKQLKQQIADGKEDTELSRLETAERLEHGDAPEVLDSQSLRRKALEAERHAKRENEKLDERAITLQSVERRQQAWEMIVPLVLPDDEKTVANVTALVERLAEATNEDHRNDVFEIIKRDLGALREAEQVKKDAAEARRKPHRPDSGTSTTSSSETPKTADDWIQAGLSKAKEK